MMSSTQRARRFLARAKRGGQRLANYAKPWIRAYTGRTAPCPAGLGFSLDHIGIPASVCTVDASNVICTFDFKPDGRSFAGMPLRQTPHFEFVQQYLAQDRFDFRQTRYYRLASRGLLPFPVRGRLGAERRAREFIYLINNIRSQGYLPDEYGPITMIHCDDGRDMVVNGKHRLAILLGLQVKEFPVCWCFENEIRAMYAHRLARLWPRRFFRKNLDLFDHMGVRHTGDEKAIACLLTKIRNAKLETWADIYHPIPFREFRGLSTQVRADAAYRRLAMILSEYADLSDKRVLDIGCNIGFYSFSLAKRGALTAGLDIRPEYIDIANEIARIYRVSARFINAPVTDGAIRDLESRYNITLCFSVLQWIIAQHGLDYGKQVLRTIYETSDALFFDTAVNAGKSCLTCPEGEELAFVHQLLRDSTGYRTIEHVGDVHPYGTDTRYVFYCTS